MMRIRRSRAGFTLMEVLIAAALSGIVLALAMNGFVQLNKVSNVTKSKLEAQQMATSALQQLSGLFKNASIIYYTGRPLKDQSSLGSLPLGDKIDNTDDPATYDVPSYLLTVANPGQTYFNFPPFQTSLLPDRTSNSSAVKFDISRFRFIEPGNAPGAGSDSPSGGVGMINGGFLNALNGQTLVPCPYHAASSGGALLDDHDGTFPSPLAYFAVANTYGGVDANGSNTGDNRVAGLPQSWDFYVLYLAPMNVQPNDANIAWAYANSPDLIPPKVAADAPLYQKRARSMIPLQLRMLYIPKVTANNPQTYTSVLAAAGTPAIGRAVSPVDNFTILDPPFDYSFDNSKPGNGGPNYDPLPIPMALAAGNKPWSFLNSVYKYETSPGTTATQPASGPRIADSVTNLHANYNQLGDDPPTNQVFNKVTGTPVDRVLVNYIDPDSVSGTCVRFINNIPPDPGTLAAANQPNYRRYLNTIGTSWDGTGGHVGSPYLYNHYWDFAKRTGMMSTANANSSVSSDGPGATPQRVFISITTRFRTTRQVPFQFSTVSAEVPLDGLTNYQQIRPKQPG